MIFDIIASILILAGSFLIFTGAVGFIRVPDFFTKLHACSVGDVPGLCLVILGVIVKFGISFEMLKLLLLMVIIFITNSSSSYALAQAALKEFAQEDKDAQQ